MIALKRLALTATVALLSTSVSYAKTCESMPDVAIYHVGQHVKLQANWDDPDAAFIFCPSLAKVRESEGDGDIGNCQSERWAIGKTFVIDECLLFSRPGAASFDLGAYAVYHLSDGRLGGWTTIGELALSKVW